MPTQRIQSIIKHHMIFFICFSKINYLPKEIKIFNPGFFYYDKAQKALAPGRKLQDSTYPSEQVRVHFWQ